MEIAQYLRTEGLQMRTSEKLHLREAHREEVRD
jgi:hypothetical protein